MTKHTDGSRECRPVDNPPAFPREDYQADDAPGQRGMSLRDYFAGQALTGMIAGSAGIEISTFEFARQSYVLADAMLAARQVKHGR